MGKYGTTFTETEIILAANNEDYEELYRLIDTLLPNEKKELSRTCMRIMAALGEQQFSLGPRV